MARFRVTVKYAGKAMQTVYECRNNEWAQTNEPYAYSTHKAHCAVRGHKIVKVFPTKKEAVAFCAAENSKK